MESNNLSNINKSENFEAQVSKLNDIWDNQKYIIESIQKLQPQTDTAVGIFEKFINIIISIITISTIGSFIMLFILNNKKKQHWSLNRDLTFIDCLYFHFATLSTVGYGDITAVSQEAKIYTILLIIITMFEIASLIDLVDVS